MLARVGVKVDLNAEPKSKFFAAISAAGGFDSSFYLLGWTPTTLESFNVFQYIMGCRDPKTNWGGNNVGDYCNPKVDALAREAPAGAGRRQARRDFRRGLANLAVRRRRLHPAASAGAGLGRFEAHARDPAAGQLLHLRLGHEGLSGRRDDRLHPAPPSRLGRRPDRGRADRLCDVPLCRRSREPDGRNRDLGPGARAAAPSARPRSADDRPGARAFS